MKKLLPLVIVILVIVVAAGFLVKTKQSTSVTEKTQTSETPAASAETVTTDTEFVHSNPDVSALRQGGASYGDEKGEYLVLYPDDYKLDVQNNGEFVRLYKRGATQKGQTEIYDGVIMNFETIDLQGKSLSNWVDNHIQQATSDGTATVTKPKTVVTLHGHPGFTYNLKSQGEGTYLALQKDAHSTTAVSISFTVNDPENVDYAKEVDSILTTLELLK